MSHHTLSDLSQTAVTKNITFVPAGIESVQDDTYAPMFHDESETTRLGTDKSNCFRIVPEADTTYEGRE